MGGHQSGVLSGGPSIRGPKWGAINQGSQVGGHQSGCQCMGPSAGYVHDIMTSAKIIRGV